MVVEKGGLPLDIISLQRRDDTKHLFVDIGVIDITPQESSYVQVIKICSNVLVHICWLNALLRILQPSLKQWSSLSLRSSVA